jgi:type I restriction enzyme M protein
VVEAPGHQAPLEARSRPVDRRELKLLTQQMSKAFRDSQGGGLMDRFEAVSKLLFTRIIDERRAREVWLGLDMRPPELVIKPGDTDTMVYERARSVWREATTTLRDVFAGSRGEFPEDRGAVVRIVRLMDGISLAATGTDIKGAVYEELLRNTFEKNENQQYFTPRQVVEFMVELADPAPGTSICDPASGSGGFLVGALARVSPEGRATAISVRGAEIDDRMAWVARINVLMHGGDPRSIHTLRGAGSLGSLTSVATALPQVTFDLILTNPPFGSDMTDREALHGFVTGRGRTSRRRGVLFVERCIELLKPGGRLAIVLDDSVLNLAGNRDIRDYVTRNGIVEAVISLPDVTFMPYSTAKSSILVIRRRETDTEEQCRVFMADVENVGVRPNGDPLYADDVDDTGRRPLKSDLPEVLRRWRAFRTGQQFDGAREGTAIFSADLAAAGNPDGRLDVFFFHPTRQEAEAARRRAAFPLTRIDDLLLIDASAVNPVDQFGDGAVRWIGLGDIEANSGRYEVREVQADRIKSASHVFRPDDVLFSRLRPKLRKCIVIPSNDDGGVCSGELLVLRVRPDAADRLSVEYIAFMLRSDLVFGQLIYQVTGVGRPRVSAEAVRRVQLPLPPLSLQLRMLSEFRDADDEARALRTEAGHRFEAAHARMQSAYASVTEELLAN